ncbi:hypothetical protein B0H16DRAFT_1742983 [Mycena metata]|uniref:Uncharacterized protein n=1 Tax=Mycena metata TaxID=1033252 RepID=A0AAD7MF23_9AGAR|nr:hypothetical protein B0H16DRAFT_1742983 [Mycena metata]
MSVTIPNFSGDRLDTEKKITASVSCGNVAYISAITKSTTWTDQWFKSIPSTDPRKANWIAFVIAFEVRFQIAAPPPKPAAQLQAALSAPGPAPAVGGTAGAAVGGESTGGAVGGGAQAGGGAAREGTGGGSGGFQRIPTEAEKTVLHVVLAGTIAHRATNQAQYTQQHAEWETRNGNVPTATLDIALTGYPLTPGTENPATGECWDCGYRESPIHRGDCRGRTRVPTLERRFHAVCGGWLLPSRNNAGVNVVEGEEEPRGVPWYEAGTRTRTRSRVFDGGRSVSPAYDSEPGPNWWLWCSNM